MTLIRSRDEYESCWHDRLSFPLTCWQYIERGDTVENAIERLAVFLEDDELSPEMAEKLAGILRVILNADYNALKQLDKQWNNTGYICYSESIHDLMALALDIAYDHNADMEVELRERNHHARASHSRAWATNEHVLFVVCALAIGDPYGRGGVYIRAIVVFLHIMLHYRGVEHKAFRGCVIDFLRSILVTSEPCELLMIAMLFGIYEEVLGCSMNLRGSLIRRCSMWCDADTILHEIRMYEQQDKSADGYCGDSVYSALRDSIELIRRSDRHAIIVEANVRGAIVCDTIREVYEYNSHKGPG